MVSLLFYSITCKMQYRNLWWWLYALKVTHWNSQVILTETARSVWKMPIVGLKILSGIEVENLFVRNTLTGRVGLDDVIFILHEMTKNGNE